jgi:D-threo-aldose 1-dehydrogenase
MDPGDPVRLGRTSLTVSRLGLGTAWLGNMYQAVEEDAATAILGRALELGVRLVDTAPLYGLGLAERRIGPVLAARPRESFALSTKVGRVLRPREPGDPELVDEGRPLFVDAPELFPAFDFSHDAVLRTFAGSLERLGLERVDIVLIHDPDHHFQQAVEGAYPALERLRDDGAVTAIGVGMNQAELLVEFAKATDIDCVLLAGRYTLLDQTGLRELLPLCAQRGISVVIGGVYNTGILADPTPGTLYNYRTAPAELLERVRRLQAVCARHGVPLKAAAIQFPFGHPAVAAVLTGVRTVAELDENARMLRLPIPAGLWAELRAERLLPEGVPVPP